MTIQERLLKIIRDDNYAAGFQSLGQYRTALLQAARGEVEPAAVQEGPMQCSACQGKGYRVAPLDIMLTCPHCQGSGKCPTPQPVKQRTAIQRKYKDWAIVRQSESAISIVHGDTYVTFSEGESDKRMPWLVDFLSSLLAGADPTPQPAEQQPVVDVSGIELAAQWVDRRAAEYNDAHGTIDPETGALEFPGDGAEYVAELDEIAEGIRALAAHRRQGGEA